MPLFPGGVEVDDVKLGASQVSSIWQGANLVWPIEDSMFVKVGLDDTISGSSFTATMPIGEEIPAGWIVVVAVQSRNTATFAGVSDIRIDGVIPTLLAATLKLIDCGQPGTNNWEHDWASVYTVWGGGVLGEVTATIAISVGTKAFVWAFDPLGFSVSSVSASGERSTISTTGTAVNISDKVIHINIANSTDSSLSSGIEYTETGTPSSTVELLLEGLDASTQAYPMMMVDRLSEQPAGGVPWALDIPGSNTGFGRYQMELILT